MCNWQWREQQCPGAGAGAGTGAAAAGGDVLHRWYALREGLRVPHPALWLRPTRRSAVERRGGILSHMVSEQPQREPSVQEERAGQPPAADESIHTGAAGRWEGLCYVFDERAALNEKGATIGRGRRGAARRCHRGGLSGGCICCWG